MKTLPPLLIVTDRGRFVAFRFSEEHTLHRIDEAEFQEGNQKISEMVTDQAGAFPGTGGTVTSAGENMSLEAELEVRCIRQIASRIEDLLEREGQPLFGLAAPSEIHGAIIDLLTPATRKRIAVHVKKDLIKMPPAQIVERFIETREKAMAISS